MYFGTAGFAIGTLVSPSLHWFEDEVIVSWGFMSFLLDYVWFITLRYQI